MSEFNDPAYPFDGDMVYQRGMTIRQAFVMAAMQGILANPGTEVTTGHGVADDAIMVADACLKAERETRG